MMINHKNAENRVVKDGQLPNAEYFGVSADEVPVPDNVNDWVRRPLQISPSFVYIMLTDEDEALAL